MNFPNNCMIFCLFHLLTAKLDATMNTGHNEDMCGRSVLRRQSARIFGGEVAAEAEFPWIVSIQKWHFSIIKKIKHHCGGSLISKKIVITAAHCLKIDEDIFKVLEVVAGLTDYSSFAISAQSRRIKSVFTHKRTQMSVNDIALILLDHSVEWTEFVRPICLPTFYDNSLSSKEGKTFLISGWGFNEEGLLKPELKKLYVPILNLQTCQRVIRPQIYVSNLTNICAGNMDGKRGTCFGDSGGPLMDIDMSGKMVLIGIVVGGTGGAHCGRLMSPTISVRVDYYLEFIEHTLRTV